MIDDPKLTKLLEEAARELDAKLRKRVRLPIAILPNKRKCCCTPETCICKKPVDKGNGSGKVEE